MSTGSLNRSDERFREAGEVDSWAGLIDLSSISDQEFDDAVEEAVRESGQNFLGFRLCGENGEFTQYVRTRYPRKKYGIPSIEECREGLGVLAEKLGKESVDELIGENRFRIVLGLVEGYGDENLEHDLEEVRSELGEGYDVAAGSVYSAGFLYGGEYSVYQEAVAVIEGVMDDVRNVYELAERFNQQRFTVDTDEKSFTVETVHCESIGIHS